MIRPPPGSAQPGGYSFDPRPTGSEDSAGTLVHLRNFMDETATFHP